MPANSTSTTFESHETGYKGDFTLKWAQNHDYDDGVKAAWVNYKGYTSKTECLVWISIAYQVNVFTGSAGELEAGQIVYRRHGRSHATPRRRLQSDR